MSGQQRLDQRLFDDADFVQLQIAFIELTIEQAFHRDLMHQ